MSELNDRQKAAWPKVIAEAKRHGVTVDDYPEWDISVKHSGQISASWYDSDHLVYVQMDRYSSYDMWVAELHFIHDGSCGQCECDPCRGDDI